MVTTSSTVMEASRPLEENLTVLRKVCPASAVLNALIGSGAAPKLIDTYIIRHATADDQQHLLIGESPAHRLAT